MRFLAPSLVMLSLAFASPARAADHPLACKDGKCADGRAGHRLSFLHPHRDAGGCEQPKSHRLFAFLKRGHGACKDGSHGHGHCKFGECNYHPWFSTFQTGPGPESAFPTHPFVRSPRDFFMYEW